MAARQAILQAMVENVLTDLMVKTEVTNVYLEDGTTTLAAKLAELITTLNTKKNETEVKALISAEIDKLIDGAPSTYDTLKEISDYISAHEDVVTAINQAIGNKVDKVEGKGLSTNDFTTALKTKLENIDADGLHTHENKSVLDGITAAKVTAWDGKAKLYVAESQPDGLTANDLFVKLIPVPQAP